MRKTILLSLAILFASTAIAEAGCRYVPVCRGERGQADRCTYQWRCD